MAKPRLVIGSKSISSWSLRGWLPLRVAGIDFDETVILFRQADTSAKIRALSPSGKVPALILGEKVLCDSLAIGEYAHMMAPNARLLPQDPLACVFARAAVAEMHTGFVALRGAMPMDLINDHQSEGMTDAVAQDIARIVQLWTEVRSSYGKEGPFLFGHFTLADVAFAPVVTRFQTYGVDLPKPAAAYRDAILDHKEMQRWYAQARQEGFPP